MSFLDRRIDVVQVHAIVTHQVLTRGLGDLVDQRRDQIGAEILAQGNTVAKVGVLRETRHHDLEAIVRGQCPVILGERQGHIQITNIGQYIAQGAAHTLPPGQGCLGLLADPRARYDKALHRKRPLSSRGRAS